ncbi:phosphate ABC transporter substrate-binding protein [Bacteroidia bacterium]|nr:phosphate ABC transporter substrate-binding protein [Bacteroidia bacterium]GHT02166.1 phosphate ABC transporter substrate-binding protein [Bacteroidia bacterium]GHT47889.1 phosphate ABC transporter substrate-binding protein [Bacteroidia bacterium]
MKRILYIGILSTLLISFVTCKKETKDKWEDTLSSGLIRIACDENFKALMETEIAVFEARNPGATIIPIYTNETEAIRLLTEDSVRFALTTRQNLSSKEQAALKDRLLKVQTCLVAFDGIALITNKANTDSIIGMPTLKKILTGEITEWSQVNANSTIGTVRVLIDNNGSGILRYALDSITQGADLTSNIYALNNDSEVIEKVAQMPNALGLIGINALNNVSSDEIRLVRLSKEEPATLANSYLPYAGDIVTENYPLWRPVYILLSDPKSGLSSGLTIFFTDEIGQTIVLKSDLLPIKDPQNRAVNIIDAYPK